MILFLLATATACGSGDLGLTEADADASTDAGVADATEMIGPTWRHPRSARFVDAVIVERCGDPRSELGDSPVGLVSAAASPTLTRTKTAGSEARYGDVRTAALAFTDNASATRAFRQLSGAALEDCLVDATNRYLDRDRRAGDGMARIPDASVDSFATTQSPVPGEEATLAGSQFDEAVIGGFDNTHNTAQYVARSGALVVTALAASNAQNPDPDNPAALAQRLGRAALERATTVPG
jgi:hypothetical protein